MQPDLNFTSHLEAFLIQLDNLINKLSSIWLQVILIIQWVKFPSPLICPRSKIFTYNLEKEEICRSRQVLGNQFSTYQHGFSFPDASVSPELQLQQLHPDKKWQEKLDQSFTKLWFRNNFTRLLLIFKQHTSCLRNLDSSSSNSLCFLWSPFRFSSISPMVSSSSIFLDLSLSTSPASTPVAIAMISKMD